MLLGFWNPACPASFGWPRADKFGDDAGLDRFKLGYDERNTEEDSTIRITIVKCPMMLYRFKISITRSLKSSGAAEACPSRTIVASTTNTRLSSPRLASD
jgi:hypothetical protein